VLLTIVYFSYRQTIAAYPGGGGSYTVATENLGNGAGLLAAAALMIDYILTAAVGISAGVTALTSAVPRLQPHTLLICLAILVVLAIVNMRGVRDTGAAFIAPTFLFVSTLLLLIAVGFWKAAHAGWHPVPMAALPAPPMKLVGTLGLWMLIKAFASGCAAMTGVEAVSNGVMAFREPRVRNAQRTLTVIIGILMVLLFGISYLAKLYRVMPMEPYDSHYQSLVSLLVMAVFGRGWFYYVTMGSVLLALALSANTAFADFPRLTRAIAQRDYLPHVFVMRGRRLLFSHGIYALTGFTAVILILSRGVTDFLIPLYAIGAFMAFTLSQAGMVVHWRRGERHSRRGWHMFVNGFGAVATGLTTVVVLVAKFTAGAWVTALLIPLLILIMMGVRRHYRRVARETEDPTPLRLTGLEAPIVVIPMARWDKITEKAMRFGMLMGEDIRVLHVDADDADALGSVWQEMVLKPVRESGWKHEPQLVTLQSTYRTILRPIIEYIFELEEHYPGRKIAVILPELVVRHWWENALHNQRAQLMKLVLLLKGNQRIVVVNIPWYL
jgi:amino acid transporter